MQRCGYTIEPFENIVFDQCSKATRYIFTFREHCSEQFTNILEEIRSRRFLLTVPLVSKDSAKRSMSNVCEPFSGEYVSFNYTLRIVQERYANKYANGKFIKKIEIRCCSRTVCWWTHALTCRGIAFDATEGEEWLESIRRDSILYNPSQNLAIPETKKKLVAQYRDNYYRRFFDIKLWPSYGVLRGMSVCCRCGTDVVSMSIR